MTTVYSSKSGRWPGSTQPLGERMCATLTRLSSSDGTPTYSSMSFGLLPAASTRTGAEMSLGTIPTLVDAASTLRAMPRRLLPAVLLAAGLLAPAEARATTRIDVPKALAAQIDRVDAAGHGPVLLPSRLGSELPRLYASGGSTRRGWELRLRASQGCGGTSICFAARFAGEAGAVPSGRLRVPLAKGRRGWFTPTRCTTYCAPPEIQWRERGLRYTIAVTTPRIATELGVLRRLADSAIANGPRR
jgi:hypothetical protein